MTLKGKVFYSKFLRCNTKGGKMCPWLTNGGCSVSKLCLTLSTPKAVACQAPLRILKNPWDSSKTRIP